MSHKRLWIAAAIIAVILIAGFVLSVPHTRDVTRTPTNAEPVNASSVVLRDVFKKGVHTITGTIEAPNACTAVTARAAVAGNASSTESIQIIISMAKNVGTCLQLPTLENFSVIVAAPASLPISATVNGKEATTTIL